MHWVIDVGLCIGLVYLYWRLEGFKEVYLRSLNNLLDSVATQDEALRLITEELRK